MKSKVKMNLILFILVIACMTIPVMAHLSCDVTMQTPKTEYSKKEQFTIDVKLTNVQTENGIMGFLGTLKYDTSSLKIVGMEAQGDWSKPQYNSDNGKIVMDNGNDSLKSDATILKITFEILESSKKDLTIELKDMQIGNGVDKYVSISSVSKNITVKDATNVITPPTAPNDGNNGGNTVKTTPTSTNISTSTPKEKLPQTGITNEAAIIFPVIGVLTIGASVCFIKMRRIGK